MHLQRLSHLLINYFNMKLSYSLLQINKVSLNKFHQKLLYANSYREFSFWPHNKNEDKCFSEEIHKQSLTSSVIGVNDDSFNTEVSLFEGSKEELPPRKINVLALPDDVEDIEFISPQLKPTFNLAAYADKSETLKHFINLGVEIAKWERNKSRHICIKILTMDFETDIKPYIFFLNDVGIPAEDMGHWLTKNPEVFQETIENLNIRINYLSSKNFSKENVSTIVKRTPLWINYNSVVIDKELGIYQRRFALTGDEVRQLVVADPKLVIFTIKNKFHLERTSIALHDELGFTKSEMKTILLKAPRIYRTSGSSLFKRFDTVHHEMGLTHDIITQFPKILLCRDQKLCERHQFLKYLNKNQYNSQKPNYVSPMAFVTGNDSEFCVNVADVSTDLYNDFLKTL